MISEIIALLEWRQQMMHKLKNLLKPILWYRNVHNQIASVVLNVDNPVNKLTTYKLQLMLINVLIRTIFEH